MRVWRVEDTAGKGPYRLTGWTTRPHIGPDRPTTWMDVTEDGRDMASVASDLLARGALHGFESIEAFRAWFDCPVELDRLQADGLFLASYKVPEEHVRMGRKQLVFGPLHARRMTQEELPSQRLDVLASCP